MLHLSSYHSNGLPTVVWSNKVNLIGEKVYKPKIHFCEHCNKPILIYGRLIPCKHVFCFTCATICLTQQQFNSSSLVPAAAGSTPPIPGPSEPLVTNQSPLNNTSNDNNSNHHNEKHYQYRHARNSNSNINCNSKNLDLHRSDSDQSFSHRDNNNGSLMSIDESTSNTTPTTIQQDSSPNLNGIQTRNNSTTQQLQPIANKGCHRCGGRALRVERNTLNSIFVCQIDTCKRTYLSARDLQAHVTHRHSKTKTHNSNNSGAPSASLAAISSSPYISSSTIMHLNSHNQSNSHRQSSSSTSTNNNSNNTNNQNASNPSHNSHMNSPNNNHHRRERDTHHHHNTGLRDRERDRERDRDRDRSRYDRDRVSYQRDRDRERDSKEYHRQSLQRAAQWAEANAQMLEKGLTR